MKSFYASLFSLFLFLPGLAIACPQISEEGYGLSYSASELYSERTVRIVAGGSDIYGCKIVLLNGDQPSGYFADAPDVELYFSNNPNNYDLRLWVEGDCDTKILVNSAAGNWFYDDDSGPEVDAQLMIENPSEGLYDIWIGTYDSDLCDSVLRMETF